MVAAKLSPSDRLSELEARMEAAEASVYSALREIQESGLYAEAGYASFETYCQDRWGYSKTHAYRLIDYDKLRQRLIADGVEHIPTEGQVRPVMKLRRLSKTEDEFLKSASNAVILANKTAPKKFDVPQTTAKHVEDAMGRFNIRGGRRYAKSDPLIDEIRNALKKLTHSKALKKSGYDFVEKHGNKAFPSGWKEVVNWLTECAEVADED